MHPSIGRYLKSHRQELSDAISRSLEPGIGADRARREAGELVDGLASLSSASEAGACLQYLQEAVRRWGDAGVESRATCEALLALVRPPGSPVPAERERAHLRELRPMMDFVPTPMLFVDTSFNVVLANRAFAGLQNEPLESLAGRPLAALFDPGSQEAIREFVAGHESRAGLCPIARVRLQGDPERTLIASREPFMPSGETTGWFVTLAADAPQIITEASLAQLLEREKSQTTKFAALLQVSNAVSNTLDLNTILTTIARLVREVIQTDECTVFLFDEQEQVLVPVVCDAKTYVQEMMAIRLRLGEGITGMVAQTGRGEIVNDAEADPRSVTVPGTPPEHSALLCVPLVTREHVAGVITLSRVGDEGFQLADLELATLFAGHCSAAISNARLYQEMRSAYDELRHTQSQLVQSAKLNALGEMAGGVAHDFNNILAAILGRTQLLLQTHTEPELRRQLEVIEQAALDGANTVRRVQEFTRLRQDERFETVDVNQVLLGVIELTRPAWESSAKRRGVNIDLHVELRATYTTAGNASELREVFTNLVLNAVDAMPSGGELWIGSENTTESVRVRVRDTGVGMDAETLAKIFDPFFTTKPIKGTGLGLSVAYGIVTRHRGSIEVESEPGVGTAFTLSFPWGAVEDAAPLADALQPLPRLRILVVDDEEAVLEVMSDLLIAMGMEVTRARGGRAGLDALDQESFDVVLTDLGMPDVNGWDLALAVQRDHPEMAVVLVTGWGFQLEEEAATTRGVDIVMAKPFSWDDVENVLRRVLPTLRERKAA